jgi:hypothetical protein
VRGHPHTTSSKFSLDEPADNIRQRFGLPIRESLIEPHHEKECSVMKHRLNARVKNWFTVGALLVLMGLTSLGYAQTASLTSAEEYWLTYMREEEKLARDVYLVLYEKWQSRIFKNISVSEQTHMDAIKTLLDKHGIADPAAGKGLGEFTNPDLQALHDELVQDGSVSLVDALEVGVFIEKTDIDDLNAGIDSTRGKDIITVYTNLLAGSNNHLDAFTANLAKR